MGRPKTKLLLTEEVRQELKRRFQKAETAYERVRLQSVLLATKGQYTLEEIAEFVAAYRGLFIFSPDGFEAGVDPCGFFILGPSSLRSALSRLLGARKGIRERVVHNAAGYVISLPARDPISRVRVWLIDRILRDPKFELLRSSRFRQERLAERNFRFTDERSGRSFRAPFGLPRPPAHEPSPSTAAPEYPLNLTVERHKRGTGAFDYILKPLRRVFETSVQIDRPVQWS